MGTKLSMHQIKYIGFEQYRVMSGSLSSKGLEDMIRAESQIIAENMNPEIYAEKPQEG